MSNLIERAESVLEWGTSYDMAMVLMRELAEEVKRLATALSEAETQIARVLADEESGEGGWGPDTTMVFVLQETLAGIQTALGERA